MGKSEWFSLLISISLICMIDGSRIDLSPKEISLTVGEKANITLIYSEPKHETLIFTINTTYPRNVWTVDELILNDTESSGSFSIQAIQVISHAIIEVINCTNQFGEKCHNISISDGFSRVSVIRSHFLDLLIILVGWAYFFAWSISFYPQIILNYQRKSVVGLNFDFLWLNIVGFSAYTIYNVMNYWDPAVQEEYAIEHPRSPLPVLMNDVIFAVHALAACLVTAVQAFIYERQNQRVHPGFLIYGGLLVGVGVLTLSLSIFQVLSYLQFVTSLSYIKMAVTCSKYFPQAVFNYQRKSTEGWSIGNVLLDFTGGLLDVMQMVLQGLNVNDWSGFVGNPVKFGLGMVSMIFDVVFFLQHYVFYRNAENTQRQYEGVDNPIPGNLHDSLDDTEERDRADSRDIIIP